VELASEDCLPPAWGRATYSSSLLPVTTHITTVSASNLLQMTTIVV